MTSTDFAFFKVKERYCKREHLESPYSVASYDRRKIKTKQFKKVAKLTKSEFLKKKKKKNESKEKPLVALF